MTVQSTANGEQLVAEPPITSRRAPTPPRPPRAVRSAPIRRAAVPLVAVLLAAVFVLSFGFGRFPVSPGDVVGVLWSNLTGSAWTGTSAVAHIVNAIRLPRLAAAVLVGLALASAGTVFQGMFRNPLVSPDLLGASAGAGLGASLAITLGWSMLGVQVSAFALGMVAVGMTWAISMGLRRDPLLGLVLAGIVTAALMSAGTGFLKYVADPDDTLPKITFWLMGGLAGVTKAQVLFLLVPIIACSSLIWSLRWRLNVLTLGDEEARALGVPVTVLRAVLVVAATLLTTTSVCVAGLVGWVGLVVPHLGRMVVGPDHRVLVPFGALLGGLYLLVVDDIARLVFNAEIPLGILTALVGAPFLAALLLWNRRW